MEYELEQQPVACVLRFQGDLGMKDQDELKRLFVRMRQGDDIRVAADMREVAYLDSSMLGTLVWAVKNLREAGGDLRFFGLRDFVANLFDITMLDKAFRIFPSESEALESFGEADTAD